MVKSATLILFKNMQFMNYRYIYQSKSKNIFRYDVDNLM